MVRGNPGSGSRLAKVSEMAGEDASLEHELERMLGVETFEPPAEFREKALWSDPAIYEEAAADPVAWWTARSCRPRM
jgi:hypothetical protein